MRDKLDVIWEKATPKESEKKSIHSSIDYEESAYAIMGEDNSPKRKQREVITNENDIKRKLERKKLERSLVNKRQIEIYHQLLEYLNSRFKPIPGEKIGPIIQKNSPSRIPLHDKERQFMDAFKIVIASGYTISESDFIQILHFIDVA